jgi:hypothetical protein
MVGQYGGSPPSAPSTYVAAGSIEPANERVAPRPQQKRADGGDGDRPYAEKIARYQRYGPKWRHRISIV